MRTFIHPNNVCCKKMTIDFTVSQYEFILNNIEFEGGCKGNLCALGILLKGKNFEEIIKDFASIKCGSKDSSCMTELCKGLQRIMDSYKVSVRVVKEEIINQENKNDNRDNNDDTKSCEEKKVVKAKKPNLFKRFFEAIYEKLVEIVGNSIDS